MERQKQISEEKLTEHLELLSSEPRNLLIPGQLTRPE
jgi:hypothetical protein